ncbi:hypothetical protein I5168_07190 [Nonlabens sp. SCSIO 43208]|uniref:hypothetical protein n=1 Tax=Nonlabens sp. SCSIO 43208 TaxID=2793009 RepID=UPI003D6A672A
MNIFLLGNIQTNFIYNWYEVIFSHVNNISVLHARSQKIGSKQAPNFIEQIEIKKKSKLYVLMIFLFNINFIKIVFLTYKYQNKRQSLFKTISKILRYYRNNQILKKDVDCYHLHFATLENLVATLGISPKKLLISFWGSDLLRTEHLGYDKVVAILLKRAKYITIQNDDLKKIIISRFGNQLSEKIIVIKFPFKTCHIEKFKSLSFKNLQRKEGFNILVGHNGHKENNHIKILHQLENLASSKINVHLLLTYGLKNDYLNQILKFKETSKLKIFLQLDFLEDKDLIDYRSKMDLMIYAPISDAMSGTVTESLYANIPVLAGNWLPYSIYHNKNFPISFFNKFSEIPGIINSNVLKPSHDVLQLHKELDRIFGTTNISSEWRGLYGKFRNTSFN